MPTYCYRTAGGELHEIAMTIDEKAKRERLCQHSHKDAARGAILIDGESAQRSLADEQCGWKNSHAGWPILSDAAGVHPNQVKAAQEHSVKIGVPTEFVTSGEMAGAAIFRDKQHRRDYMRKTGYFDRSAYYG